MKNVKERLFQRTKTIGDCTIWTGSLDSSGYGKIVFNNKLIGTHRLSYQLFYGPIPNKKLICHRCDNRKCIRPEHLFIGTHSENTKDAWTKGRMKSNDVKLNWQKVDEIRFKYTTGKYTHRSLALEYGVCNSTIWDILNFNHWKNSPLNLVERNPDPLK